MARLCLQTLLINLASEDAFLHTTAAPLLTPVTATAVVVKLVLVRSPGLVFTSNVVSADVSDICYVSFCYDSVCSYGSRSGIV